MQRFYKGLSVDFEVFDSATVSSRQTIELGEHGEE